MPRQADITRTEFYGTRTRGTRFTVEEKRDLVLMIDAGWHPLDVAVMFGMSVRRCVGKPSLYSTVYNNYQKWQARYGAL